MQRRAWKSTVAGLTCLLAVAGVLVCGCSKRSSSNGETPMRLSHEQTLDWIQQHRAWRLAKKVKPIWARALRADEIGRPFQDGVWMLPMSPMAVFAAMMSSRPKKMDATAANDGPI